MRKITKEPEPKFWTDFKKKNPKKAYNDLDKSNEGQELRSKIRDFMIKNQKGLCCYCCKSIDSENSHNEHIRPQKSYPNLSMDYKNLLVSCTTPAGKELTCGNKKCDKYDSKLFISPLDNNCGNHFRYLFDGRIEGTSVKGRYTINLLNLNSYDLIQARKTLFRQCEKTAKLDKELVYDWYIREKEDGTLPHFVDMVQFFYDLEAFKA